MRVLLDANIFISYLLKPTEGGVIREIVKAAVLGEFTLLLPEALLEVAIELPFRNTSPTPAILSYTPVCISPMARKTRRDWPTRWNSMMNFSNCAAP